MVDPKVLLLLNSLLKKPKLLLPTLTDQNIWDLPCKLKKLVENKTVVVKKKNFGINQEAKEIQLLLLFLLEDYHIQVLKIVLLTSFQIVARLLV